MIIRKKTRQIHVGNVAIGGDAPIVVQSMTNTDTADVESTVEQIHRLQEVGCELIRVAVPDLDAARAITSIRSQITIPLIADIHFDSRLAVAAVEHGAQAIRINPDYAEAHYSLGVAYLLIRDRNSALDEYKILEKLDIDLANKLFDLIY